jgi:hypothetical protein
MNFACDMRAKTADCAVPAPVLGNLRPQRGALPKSKGYLYVSTAVLSNFLRPVTLVLIAPRSILLYKNTYLNGLQFGQMVVLHLKGKQGQTHTTIVYTKAKRNSVLQTGFLSVV